MQKAIVAIEDSRFYEHGAIDLKGVLRALNQNAQSGGVSQGASTLTQQYVKNVFVEEAGDDPTKVAQATQQTIGRKIQELKYAIQVEEELGKKKILENYLNITFFGAAGVRRRGRLPALLLQARQGPEPRGGRAARRHRPVAEPLRPGQRRGRRRPSAATPCSSAWPTSTTSPRRRPTRRKETPLGLKVSKPKNGCITAVKGAGFFCDYVREVVPDRPGLRQDQGGPGQGLEPGRPDDPDDAGPAGAEVGPDVDQGPRLQDGRGRHRRHAWSSRAPARSWHGPVAAVRLRQERDRRSTSRSTRTWAARTSASRPARRSSRSWPRPPSSRACRRRRCTPSPYEMHYPSPVADLQRQAVDQHTGDQQLENENESEVGPYAHEGGDGEVGQHLLRAADQRHRPLPGRRRWPTKLGVARADGEQAPRGARRSPSGTQGSRR